MWQQVQVGILRKAKSTTEHRVNVAGVVVSVAERFVDARCFCMGQQMSSCRPVASPLSTQANVVLQQCWVTKRQCRHHWRCCYGLNG
jgi:hypothetical protein